MLSRPGRGVDRLAGNEPAGVDDGHAIDGHRAKAVDRVDVERARLGQRAALGELPSLRSSSSTISSAPAAVEPGDHHRIVAAVEGHGEDRRIAVAVAVGQRVVERVGQRRARRQRIDRRLARGRQRVGLGAVGVERDRAVGAGQAGEGRGSACRRRRRRRWYRRRRVTAIGPPSVRLGAIVVRDRHVVDDRNRQRRGVGVAVAIGDDHVEQFLGRVAARVVAERVAVADRAVGDAGDGEDADRCRR